jgi:hypothetical protein
MDTANQTAPAGAPESGIRQPAPDGRPASDCYALLDVVVSVSPGYASLEQRARECRAMLAILGCDNMGHGNTLTGMVQAACREILRLRHNDQVSNRGSEDEH